MKVFAFIACSVILTLLLLIVVMNIDREPEQPQTALQLDDIPELIPQALTQEELSGTDFDRQRFATPDLDGGSIEVANEDGSLAQEYRFLRLNPRPDSLPAGWLEMVEPFAVIYGSDGQIITLKGDIAQAKSPKNNGALESGTLTGNVEIKVFQGEPGMRYVPGALSPSMIVRTNQASFDNVVGEIRCNNDVVIASTTVDMMGSALRLQINDQQDIAQLLTIDSVRYILLHAERKIDALTPAQPDREFAFADGAHTPPSPAPENETTPTPTASPMVGNSRDETQFYQLTLSDNVRIVQDDPVIGRTSLGDAMTIVFSFESQGFDGMFAFDAQRSDTNLEAYWTYGPISRETWLMSAAFATIINDDLPLVREGETLITFDGPLTMVPLSDPADRPASPRDARLTITGAPVVMRDLASDTEARCGSFIYTTENGLLQLTRTAEHPVQFENPDYVAEGEHMWIDQSLGIGSFEGSGWLVSRVRTDVIEVSVQQDAQDSDEVPADANADPLERLRVVWQGGVKLDFQQSEAGDPLGPLKNATFQDNVRVQADEGAIDCNTLDLAFRQNDQGETIPQSMTATGEAKLRSLAPLDPDTAGDGPQTIWADIVRVTFMENPQEASVNETAESANPFGSDTTVETLHADGDVQLLLSDGTRVFADTLDGNARQEEVTLEGENIVFVSGPVIIERGKKVHMVKSEGAVHWFGPGMARIFTNPIDVTVDQRIERPVLANDDAANPRQARSTWIDSMRYEGRFNDGAGRLLLAGEVDIHSTPSPLETTTMTSDDIEIQFAMVPRATPDTTDRPDPQANPQPELSRKLGILIARGESRIESRKRYESHPDIKPQVFYLASEEYLEYDDRTFEALIEGAGDLLLRDLLPDETNASNRSVPFGGKGTTEFKWNERFTMKHIVDEYYEIAMSGDITGMHHDLQGKTANVTGDQFTAGVTRSDVVRQQNEQDGALLMGTGIEFQQIRGTGGIFVHTATRDIACHEFEYNLLTHFAHASASPGGRVTVKTRGEARPVYAQSIDWNLATDRIEVRRAGGSTGR